MKKIVCPRCGTINLEKFVTFPHCAGCSSLLQATTVAAPPSIWRRPVRLGAWSGLLGVALAGAVALSFASGESGEPQQMVVYAQVPRQARLGQGVACRASLESVKSARRSAGLREVSWQLARGMERHWRVVGASPEPDQNSIQHGKPTWSYRAWSDQDVWTVRLQPRGKGTRPLAIVVNAAGHYPVRWRADVAVR